MRTHGLTDPVIALRRQTDYQFSPNWLSADLRKKRDEFEVTVKKQAKAGEAAWETTKAHLETQWKGFEAEVEKYLETFGKDTASGNHSAYAPAVPSRRFPRQTSRGMNLRRPGHALKIDFEWRLHHPSPN
jgi:hypothetical protein